MFLHKLPLALIALIALLGCRSTERRETTRGPDLGVPARAADFAAWDISIDTDGIGLPPGAGSVKDGAAVYREKCAACHGETGSEGPLDRLAGGSGHLTDEQPMKTVGSYWPYATTLFDYTRRAMPYQQPKSLTDDEVYAVSAYLLFLNGIVDETFTADARTLPRVAMPNRNGFDSAWPLADP